MKKIALKIRAKCNPIILNLTIWEGNNNTPKKIQGLGSNISSGNYQPGGTWVIGMDGSFWNLTTSGWVRRDITISGEGEKKHLI